jgi:TfoX/Sxy family transcriptional regulator of competence genes
MATDADFVDYIAEQADLGERLTRKKMFGEYALYLDGKVVAFVCDNSLFIKPTAAVEQLAPGLPQRPPYPVARPYPVADELLDDSEALQRLLIRTAALLPVPRPRTKKSPKKKKPATPRQARP